MLLVDNRKNCLCLEHGVEDVTMEPPMARIPLLFKLQMYLFEYTTMYRRCLCKAFDTIIAIKSFTGERIPARKLKSAF